MVADVDDDEDEEEDIEEDGKGMGELEAMLICSHSNVLVLDTFLDEPGAEGEDLDDINHRAAHHARLDRRERELNDDDLVKLAQDVTRRYRPTAQKYTGDMNEIPQRLLMPSVQDASLWQVRVRVSKPRLLPIEEPCSFLSSLEKNEILFSALCAKPWIRSLLLDRSRFFRPFNAILCQG